MNLKDGEVYIPLLATPGEDGQVDFGYCGKYLKDGREVKVWVISLVSSHSRYSYYQLVLYQKVDTFINCHIHAFEYFQGVPKTVKLDNLKAGVIAPSFYEPVLQQQYSEFLNYYGAAAITCRIERGQDKGKVEAGIKYLKNNFIKGIEHRDYYKLVQDLSEWNNEVCNKRVHGTTRKVPLELFQAIEKETLMPLPSLRYQMYTMENRRVNNYAHVAYKHNFYSVPYTHAGETLTIQSYGTVLKVFKRLEQVALHPIVEGEGLFITQERHKPPYKQTRQKSDCVLKAREIGEYVETFMGQLQKEKPHQWQRMMKGIFKLTKTYQNYMKI